MDMTQSPEYQKLLAKYTRLKNQLAIIVEERADLVYHKAVSIKAEYIIKIGKFEYQLFELECSIARTKRKVDMIQTYINMQIPINEAEIEKQLNQEYKRIYGAASENG